MDRFRPPEEKPVYRVVVTRWVVESAEIEVEADHRDDVEEYALEIANEQNLDWEHHETESIEVDTIERLG